MASIRLVAFVSMVRSSLSRAAAPADASAANRFHSSMKPAQKPSSASGCISREPSAASTLVSSVGRRTRRVLRHPPPFRAS